MVEREEKRQGRKRKGSVHGEKEGKLSMKQHQRVIWPSTLCLWNAKPLIF